MIANSTHHAVDAVLVSGKFRDLHGIMRIGDIPDSDIRHMTTFTRGQKLAITGECQRSYGFATSVQHVRLTVPPWIE